jgi:hypothetical protein
MNRLIAGNFALLVVLALAGCQPKSTSSVATEETVTLGPQFSVKKGLLVPEDTRRSLGLKIIEVKEQKLAATLEFQLRVYQATKSTSLASGRVTLEQAKELKTGEPLVICTREGRSVTGKISILDDQLQKAAGMIEVLAEIPNALAQFEVGDFLQASGTLESGESIVTIPRAALLHCSDAYSVYTVSGEHLIRTPVKIGAANADLVEIKDGLYAGDQVVLQPVMSLWLTELAAVKGGQSCCVAPPKGK